jgi:hypothetical protein
MSAVGRKEATGEESGLPADAFSTTKKPCSLNLLFVCSPPLKMGRRRSSLAISAAVTKTSFGGSEAPFLGSITT